MQRLPPVVLHCLVQKAYLPRKAGARLAQEQMQPDAQIQREGDLAVLHLRERPTRLLACDQ